MLAGADLNRKKGGFGMKWSKKVTFGPLMGLMTTERKGI